MATTDRPTVAEIWIQFAAASLSASSAVTPGMAVLHADEMMKHFSARFQRDTDVGWVRRSKEKK